MSFVSPNSPPPLASDEEDEFGDFNEVTERKALPSSEPIDDLASPTSMSPPDFSPEVRDFEMKIAENIFSESIPKIDNSDPNSKGNDDFWGFTNSGKEEADLCTQKTVETCVQSDAVKNDTMTSQEQRHDSDKADEIGESKISLDKPMFDEPKIHSDNFDEIEENKLNHGKLMLDNPTCDSDGVNQVDADKLIHDKLAFDERDGIKGNNTSSVPDFSRGPPKPFDIATPSPVNLGGDFSSVFAWDDEADTYPNISGDITQTEENIKEAGEKGIDKENESNPNAVKPDLLHHSAKDTLKITDCSTVMTSALSCDDIDAIDNDNDDFGNFADFSASWPRSNFEKINDHHCTQDNASTENMNIPLTLRKTTQIDSAFKDDASPRKENDEKAVREGTVIKEEAADASCFEIDFSSFSNLNILEEGKPRSENDSESDAEECLYLRNSSSSEMNQGITENSSYQKCVDNKDNFANFDTAEVVDAGSINTKEDDVFDDKSFTDSGFVTNENVGDFVTLPTETNTVYEKLSIAGDSSTNLDKSFDVDSEEDDTTANDGNFIDTELADPDEDDFADFGAASSNNEYDEFADFGDAENDDDFADFGVPTSFTTTTNTDINDINDTNLTTKVSGSEDDISDTKITNESAFANFKDTEDDSNDDDFDDFADFETPVAEKKPSDESMTTDEVHYL